MFGAAIFKHLNSKAIFRNLILNNSKIIRYSSEFLNMEPVKDACAETEIKTDEMQNESQDNSTMKRPHPEDEGTQSDVKRVKNEDVPQANKPFKFSRKSKKKVALLMIYSGKDYYGMQRNPGFKTIEQDLLDSLVKSELVPEYHAINPNQMSFQRAARTDKGVSAAGQVVSLKMHCDESSLEKINKNLPEEIRTISIKQVTKGFNSKNSCSHRSYSYLIPTFAFTPIEECVIQEYRLPKDNSIIDRVNEVLSLYKGTHNFHNFTSGKKFNDPSANRYIMDMKIGQPFEQDGLEFAVIMVKGQSFMLHQIRKMIGLMVAVVRGLCTTKAIELSWQEEKVDVPKAPGLGLMLEQVHYDSYNRKFGNDGLHDSLSWEEYKNEIDEFKEKYIYSTIVKTEKEERPMMKWLGALHSHTFDTRRNLEVPPEAEAPLGVAQHKVNLENTEIKKEDQDGDDRPSENNDKESDLEVNKCEGHIKTENGNEGLDSDTGQGHVKTESDTCDAIKNEKQENTTDISNKGDV